MIYIPKDIYYYDKFYPTKIARKYDKYLERSVLKKSDCVSTVSNGFKRLFVPKAERLTDKIKVLPNGFDLNDFKMRLEFDDNSIKFRLNPNSNSIKIP